MSPEENKEICRLYYLISGTKQWHRLPEVTDTSNYYFHFVGLTPHRVSAMDSTHYLAALDKGLPDMAFEPDELLAEGDRVIARGSVRGTHGGPLFGIEATHRPINIPAVDIVTLEDGKIVDRWFMMDIDALKQQIS